MISQFWNALKIDRFSYIWRRIHTYFAVYNLYLNPVKWPSIEQKRVICGYKIKCNLLWQKWSKKKLIDKCNEQKCSLFGVIERPTICQSSFHVILYCFLCHLPGTLLVPWKGSLYFSRTSPVSRFTFKALYNQVISPQFGIQLTLFRHSTV